VLFTNDALFGGTFRQEFEKKLKNSSKVTIATGYAGHETLKRYQKELVSVARRGQVRVLLGMVFHSGVGKQQLAVLQGLNDELRGTHTESGVFISLEEYHGKIYLLDNDVYVGSSNFSASGIDSRWECSTKVSEPSTEAQVRQYVDYLFLDKHAKGLEKVDLRRPTPATSDSSLDGMVPTPWPQGPVLGEMRIQLRVDAQPRSSLNLFFDKGRKNAKTGLYAPRPWYEVELTTTTEERNNPWYPETQLLKPGKKSRVGTFEAYVSFRGETFRMTMSVGSDNGKAIASSEHSGGRATLGRFLKGKLEDAKLLSQGQRITSQTLEEYGRDFVTLKKLTKDEYILEF